jgi:ligand-binding SRPBCC domain-containing protein
MKVFHKKWISELPISLSEAWHFFSRPENLNEITPPDMNFIIHSDIKQKEMYEGMMILYTVSPLWGIPMPWATEISHIEPGKYFIDEQRSGPYKIWHHEHHFKRIDDHHTEMTDILHYALPFGFFGQIAHSLFIGDKIEAIFAYRQRVLEQKFSIE